MLKIIKFELLKLFTSKLFIYTFIVFMLVNVSILFYTENLAKENDIAYSSYKMMNQELSGLSQENKGKIISNEYEKIYAINLINNIRNLRNSSDEGMREYGASLKEENTVLYDKYIDIYESTTQYKYTGEILKELTFLETIKTEFDSSNEYEKTINNILERADNLETLSIFKESQDSFSNKNIKDTANQYSKMKDIQLNYQLSKGIDSFTKTSVTDIFIVLLVFVISSIIVFEEKEKNLFTLIKSTKNGRTKTIISKIAVLLISVVAISLIMYLVNFIYYGIRIGYGDLGTSLQSINSFMYSTLKINIWQYLIIFIFTKIAVYFLISLIILLISIIAKNNFTTYLVFILVFMISFGLYTGIDPNSKYNFFRYINMLNLLEVNGMYNTYMNLKIFGIMQNLLTLALIFAIILSVSLVIGNIILFSRKRDLQIRENNILSKIKSFSFTKYKVSTKVFTNELYKLFITNKVVILLIIFALFQIYNFNNTNRTLSFNENIYKNYMEVLEGKLTDDKEVFIKTEQNKYKQAEESIANIENLVISGEISKIEAKKYKEPYEEILSTKEIFSKVEEKYAYIKNNSKAEFVYDTGYNELLRVWDKSFIESDISLIIISIISFTSIFVMEYKTGIISILNTTPKGRKHTSKTKVAVCVIASVSIFIISIIPEIFKISQVYGFSGIDSSIVSLEHFRTLSPHISILGYIVIMYAARLIMLTSIMLLILWISLKLKNTIYSILITSSLLIMPMILFLLGFDVIRNISIIPVLNISKVILAGGKLYLLYVIIPIVVGIGSYYKLCKHFE